MKKENEKLIRICPRATCSSLKDFEKIIKKEAKSYVCWNCRRTTIAVKPQIAQYKVFQAKKKGTLIKTPCIICGENKSEAHHENYNKPLYVFWLCKKHHMARHKEINKLRKQHKNLHQSKIISLLINK
jgi:hypothetical protein